MNQLIKVIVFFLVVYQSHEVNSKKYFKILTIEKEPGHEHEVLLYHYKPISFIKETITPFGTFSYRHSVEKRDLHKRRTREIEDLIEIPNVAIKEELKPILDEKVAFTSIPTDIILTRMEFYKGKPLKLHTISTPTSLEHELHNDETEDTNEKAIPEPVPLSTPEHSSDISDKSNEVIGDQNGVATNIDLNTEVEKMSSTTEVKSDSENLKLTEDNHEKEVSLDEKTASGTEINTSSGDTKVDDKESSQIEETSPEAEIKSDSEEIKVPESNHEKETSPETSLEIKGKSEDLKLNTENNEEGNLKVEDINSTIDGKPDDAKLSEEHHEVEKETTEQKSLNEHSESGVIENRDVETEATQDINKNVELVAPLNSDDLSSKSTIEVAQTVKPVETPSFPVSPLPVPVYIPFYTEIRNPQPIEPVVNIPPEIPAEIHEVVSVVPPVVVITEKKVILPPPPPPPVQTVETVIETEQRPSLFSRGSRFMLNISSRILKKLLRFVSSARSRLHLGPAEE